MILKDFPYYFQGDLSIPNLVAGEQYGLADKVKKSNPYIERLVRRYEKVFLVDALGLTLANELYSKFERQGNWIVEPEPVTEPDPEIIPLTAWKELVDGDGAEWLGLRYSIGDDKYSMIAAFVFCKYLEKLSQGDLTELGVSKSDVEHSTLIGVDAMYSTIWNRFVMSYQSVRYREIIGISLWEYLNQSEWFNTDNFSRYRLKNRFGL